MKKPKVRDTMDDQIKAACREDGQTKVRVFYSAYEEDANDEPINNLSTIAFEGKVILVGYADDFWGGDRSRDYYSPVLENPTWLEVCVHANRMIFCTRDRHHVFLEGLDPTKEIQDGVPVYEFVMGS